MRKRRRSITTSTPAEGQGTPRALGRSLPIEAEGARDRTKRQPSPVPSPESARVQAIAVSPSTGGRLWWADRGPSVASMESGRFATDTSLAAFARRLRVLGYDVRVVPEATLERLCAEAAGDRRVVLTLSRRVPRPCAQ